MLSDVECAILFLSSCTQSVLEPVVQPVLHFIVQWVMQFVVWSVCIHVLQFSVQIPRYLVGDRKVTETSRRRRRRLQKLASV